MKLRRAPQLNAALFEELLMQLSNELTNEAQSKGIFATSSQFENKVRDVLERYLAPYEIAVDRAPHPHAFPDIVLEKFGIEVKFTTNDTWRSIANSVFESTRNADVENIYLVFGKMGGTPEVRFKKYDDCVIHVRTSHVPRFEVEMSNRQSLFSIIGVSYSDFNKMSIHERMEHVRKYARQRLKTGERLWWLEDPADQDQHTLPLEVQLYVRLSKEEKRKCRAEAALLNPKVVGSSKLKGKYIDAVMYLLTYKGILCPQARDLFSAGSVAGKDRGGIYIQRSLKDIEKEMISAANYLDDALFVEYWGKSVPSNQRITTWLAMADEFAVGWVPSKTMFQHLTLQ